MWKTKTFKTYQAQQDWIRSNSHKFQIVTIYLNNGYGVEFKPLRII